MAPASAAHATDLMERNLSQGQAKGNQGLRQGRQLSRGSYSEQPEATLSLGGLA